MEANRAAALDAQATPCPACGASISTSSIGRRRRVQCPKCRQVVDLRAVENPVADEGAASESGDRVPLTRLEALEARIAALEEAAKATPHFQPIEVVVQRPDKKWKWLTHSDSHEAEKLPTNITEVFLQNLGNYDGETITIQLANGDKRALARAMSLKDVFDRAHWTVIGPGEIVPRATEPGLFLAVGGVPLPPAAAAAYFAMSTSGFAIESFLDPQLGNEDTILIVA